MRPAVARMAARLVALARRYRASARVGASRLPWRSRLAVLAADSIYGAIGEKVVTLGPRAWDRRVRVGKAAKLTFLVLAVMRSMQRPTFTRTDLWQRPGQDAVSTRAARRAVSRPAAPRENRS